MPLIEARLILTTPRTDGALSLFSWTGLSKMKNTHCFLAIFLSIWWPYGVLAATLARCEDVSTANEAEFRSKTTVPTARCEDLRKIAERLGAMSAREEQDSQSVARAILDALAVKNSLVHMSFSLDRYRRFFAISRRE